MRVVVIGSRGLSVDDFGLYLPDETTEIISGGARGVDTSAREYALSHGIRPTRSRGTMFVIDKCNERCVPVRIYTPVRQEK